LAWWRTPVIPAGACVIGNLPLDSKDLEFDFLSLVGTLPIMLGDPRKLQDSEKEILKSWSDWLRKMQETYNYMIFRQDLPCFGEPAEGQWDGWARINTDTGKGGIIGVFRQGATEQSRIVTINRLIPDAQYAVIRAKSNEKVVVMTGKQLKNEGFKVQMEKEYQGKLFEIRKLF
jgi:alpha-galactosidase